MQDADTYLETAERLEIPSREKATQALEQILSNGLQLFHRKAYRLLRNAADAEDAVQDAFLAAYTHLDQFRGQAQMSTWLTSIVLNCARMRLRRRLHHVQVSLDEPIGEIQALPISERLADCRPSPEDEYRNSELSTRLSNFHTQLSPTLRRTFELREIEGLSIRETARILGIPTGTVKAQSARARKKVKEWMQRALKTRSHSLRDRLPVSGIFGRRRDNSILQHADSEK